MARSITGLVLIVGLAIPAHASAQANAWTAAADEVVALIRDHFMDQARGAAWATEHLRYAAEVHDQAGFVVATRQALARLATSHTSYYTADDPEYYGLLSIFRESLQREPIPLESIGVDVAPGNFVRVVFAGSPADRAGLQRGDLILQADGQNFHPVRSLRGRAGQDVRLVVQADRAGPTREVVVVPRRLDPQQEWLEAQRQGSRVIDQGGKKVAFMPYFSGAGEVYQAILKEAITEQFAGADALVLDFRNGWGGANPDFVTLFSPLPPVLDLVARDGSTSQYDTQWRKPLVILINEGSRSGKEVVAFAVQQRRLGSLVGARSAGAVVSGRPFLLRDGSLLYLAVSDTRVDGHRLEGEGVSPDVPVADPLPFAHGADPQWHRAVEVAAAAVK